MELFDLHCDTAFECAARLGGVDIRKGAWHLSLDRGKYLDGWRQVFAVFMPDEYRGADAVAHYERVRDYLYRQERLFPGEFLLGTFTFFSLWYFLMTAAAAAAAAWLQSCPTLCDPRDASPPGSPVPGILQARTLEWVAISFSNA